MGIVIIVDKKNRVKITISCLTRIFVQQSLLTIRGGFRGHLVVALTSLPRPRVSNIRKKRIAQSGEMGIRATASGYAMKTRP